MHIGRPGARWFDGAPGKPAVRRPTQPHERLTVHVSTPDPQ
ncbi:hypothetical protein [Kribbella pratensis]|nr:hypothetical protein [Kribbella pratensis]